MFIIVLQTLARVISTVVKFSPDQTRRILEYEEAKTSVRTIELVISNAAPANSITTTI